MPVLEHQQRRRDDQRLLRDRARPRPGRGRRAEPGQPGAGPPARRRAHHRRHRDQEHRGLHGRPRLLLARQPLQRAVHQQLPGPYVRDALKRVPGVGNVHHLRRAQVRDAVWLDPARLAARGVTAGDVVGALREQNVQVAAGALGDAPADAEPGLQPERAREGPADGAGRVRERRREGGHGRRAGARARRRPRRAGRRDLLVQPALHRARGLRHGHPAAADRQRARRLPGRDGGDGAAREELPARARVAARLRQRGGRARVDQGGADHARRGDRAGACW